MNITLYHGSRNVISNPTPLGGRRNNDYGQGFYCTLHYDIACEWAVDKDVDGFVNSYDFDMKNMNILNLSSEEYSILNWLALLLENRIVTLNLPIMKSGAEYILKNYRIDTEKYDIIQGYRADDSYFSFVRAFVSNAISLEQLKTVMHLGNLGEQICIKSEKAFNRLRFLEAAPVPSGIFYPIKYKRDIDAREAFNTELSAQDENGTFIMDLIRKDGKVL